MQVLQKLAISCSYDHYLRILYVNYGVNDNSMKSTKNKHTLTDSTVIYL